MSILQPIKPQYCELIASGKKTIEVRKTRPKCELPVKVYIYCTKDKWQHLVQMPDKTYRLYNGKEYGKFYKSLKFSNEANSKVIGEYVCDEIEEFSPSRSPYETDSTITKASCLSIVELIKYSDMDKPLYAWHISDLVIYDKPKELREFYTDCDPDDKKCQNCPHYTEPDIYGLNFCKTHFEKHLTHPPQSWCYVEEV